MSSAPDARLIRAACQLALDVAFDGERADPPVPAPRGLRQMFGFRKLSKTSLATIARAIDGDEAFRDRVATEATEESVGRAGYVWLTRPEGWETDPSWTTETETSDPSAISKLRRERDGAEARANRFRRDAENSEAARLRAVEQLDDVRRRAEAAEAALDDARGQLAEASEERRRAVRSLKDAEGELAAARGELKVARDATREAEADRLALEEQIEAMEGSGIDASDQVPESLDRDTLRRAVQAASGAVVELGRALDEASAALDLSPVSDRVGGRATSGQVASGRNDRPRRSVGRAGRAKRTEQSRGRPDRRAALPPGIFENSPEGDRHLVTSAAALLLVDGYNLARARWSDLTPEEERRRTVRLLEETQARSGARVIVVFDGASDEVSPVASRAISVRYSPTGVTADDVVLEILAGLPDDQPVIVVSSDREVADGARDQGATVMGSSAFLDATDR